MVEEEGEDGGGCTGAAAQAGPAMPLPGRVELPGLPACVPLPSWDGGGGAEADETDEAGCAPLVTVFDELLQVKQRFASIGKGMSSLIESTVEQAVRKPKSVQEIISKTLRHRRPSRLSQPGAPAPAPPAATEAGLRQPRHSQSQGPAKLPASLLALEQRRSEVTSSISSIGLGLDSVALQVQQRQEVRAWGRQGLQGPPGGGGAWEDVWSLRGLARRGEFGHRAGRP